MTVCSVAVALCLDRSLAALLHLFEAFDEHAFDEARMGMEKKEKELELHWNFVCVVH
jgi:hypothetical protein